MDKKTTQNPLEIIFENQKELDKHIHKKHNVTYANTKDELIVALGTELAELANEIRCFKFWSVKEPSSDDVIIEEFVDGLHFITAIALAYKMEPEDIKMKKSKKVNDKKFLNLCIKNLFFDLSILNDNKGISKWFEFFRSK